MSANRVRLQPFTSLTRTKPFSISFFILHVYNGRAASSLLFGCNCLLAFKLSSFKLHVTIIHFYSVHDGALKEHKEGSRAWKRVDKMTANIRNWSQLQCSVKQWARTLKLALDVCHIHVDWEHQREDWWKGFGLSKKRRLTTVIEVKCQKDWSRCERKKEKKFHRNLDSCRKSNKTFSTQSIVQKWNFFVSVSCKSNSQVDSFFFCYLRVQI